MQQDEVWEIVLGRKVGPLQLGATLSEAISVLKRRTPVRPFEIEYNEDEPYTSHIVITSPEDGFKSLIRGLIDLVKLQFHCVTQVLMAIDVYQVNNIALRYQSNILCGKDVTCTFQSVYQLVGPTYPGKYDPTTKLYTLHYSGGSFRFPIPKEFEKLYKNKDTLPLELPNGSTPAAIGFSIYSGSEMPSATTDTPPPPLKQHYYEPVVVDLSTMHKIEVTFPQSSRSIAMGATPQDVVSALGPPSSTYFKSSLDATGSTGGEYYHNFADLGVDVMYSPWHVVTKIILRTNLPGHGEFNSYLKCNYELRNFGATTATPPPAATTVTPETTWATMLEALAISSDDLRPIVFDNGSAKDPFHASRFYVPFDGCLVEVLKNDCVASVTLTCPP